MAGKIILQKSLQKPYERRLFISEVLNPVFQNRLEVLTSPINETSKLSDGEAKLIRRRDTLEDILRGQIDVI